jgi:RNA polymerase sigma-70 factor (sigma-E family)
VRRPGVSRGVVGKGRESRLLVEVASAEWVAPEPAFGRLYEARFAEMVRLAFLMTGSLETAEDLVQDSFVRLHRKWSSVRTPDAYLRTAVVNACRSHHRRRARERSRRVESEGVAVLGADELSDLLLTLPHRQRAAIVLRYYHDLPDREIAEVLNCRVGTVASSIHRALARLRMELNHE